MIIKLLSIYLSLQNYFLILFSVDCLLKFTQGKYEKHRISNRWAIKAHQLNITWKWVQQIS